MSLPNNTTKINNLISGIGNLPVASEYTAGTGIDITNNEISLDSSAQASLGKADTALQSIPVASASELGGVKVGTNLSIADGVLSATDTTYTAGTGVDITSGVISVDNTIATTTYVDTAISTAIGNAIGGSY